MEDLLYVFLFTFICTAAHFHLGCRSISHFLTASSIVKIPVRINPTNKSAVVKLMRRIVDRLRKNLRRQKTTILVALTKIMRIPNRRKTTISFTSFSSPETSFEKVSLVSFFVFSNEAVEKISIEL